MTRPSSLMIYGIVDAGVTFSNNVGRSAKVSAVPQTASWVGDGVNEPVTADQITLIIGEQQLVSAAETLGRDKDDLAKDLAAELPAFIDSATPDGALDPSRAEGEIAGIQIRLIDSTPAQSAGQDG